jgi:SOS response associated peptidase (SRAP)
MGGNPAFRGTRVPVHLLAELVPSRVRAHTCGRRGSHNRMPAILAPEAWPAWLCEEPADLARLKALLGPYPSQGMICWPVSPRVGNVRNNDSSLIEPVAAA